MQNLVFYESLQKDCSTVVITKTSQNALNKHQGIQKGGPIKFDHRILKIFLRFDCSSRHFQPSGVLQNSSPILEV